MNGLVFQYISTDRVNATAAVISNLLSLLLRNSGAGHYSSPLGGGGGKLKDTLGL